VNHDEASRQTGEQKGHTCANEYSQDIRVFSLLESRMLVSSYSLTSNPGWLMKSPKSGIYSLVLFVVLCGFTVFAVGQCVTCNCTSTCSCPECTDAGHFPGYCSTLGCQNGASCCPQVDCGKCACDACNPSFCLAVINGCTAEGCPFSRGGRAVEDIDANNHLQPWMVDQTLPRQLAAYSRTWGVLIATLQRDFTDTTVPLASRRKLLLPSIDHAEFAVPEYDQSIVIATRYGAQKGGWVFRLIRGLTGDQSKADMKADILTLTPHVWSLHHEATDEHIADGKIAPMTEVLPFPTNANVEAQAAGKLAKTPAAKN
jgi:hypothetical protein